MKGLTNTVDRGGTLKSTSGVSVVIFPLREDELWCNITLAESAQLDSYDGSSFVLVSRLSSGPGEE